LCCLHFGGVLMNFDTKKSTKMGPLAMKYSCQPVQEFIKDGHTCVVPEDYVLSEED
jgi:hypothetical protein